MHDHRLRLLPTVHHYDLSIISQIYLQPQNHAVHPSAVLSLCGLGLSYRTYIYRPLPAYAEQRRSSAHRGGVPLVPYPGIPVLCASTQSESCAYSTILLWCILQGQFGHLCQYLDEKMKKDSFFFTVCHELVRSKNTTATEARNMNTLTPYP